MAVNICCIYGNYSDLIFLRKLFIGLTFPWTFLKSKNVLPVSRGSYYSAWKQKVLRDQDLSNGSCNNKGESISERWIWSSLWSQSVVSLKQCVLGTVFQRSQHSLSKHKHLRKTQIILPGDWKLLKTETFCTESTRDTLSSFRLHRGFSSPWGWDRHGRQQLCLTFLQKSNQPLLASALNLGHFIHSSQMNANLSPENQTEPHSAMAPKAVHLWQSTYTYTQQNLIPVKSRVCLKSGKASELFQIRHVISDSLWKADTGLLHPKLHPLIPQPQSALAPTAPPRAALPSSAPGCTQSPESQPPSPNPSVPQQHPSLRNRWLGTAVRETLGETWMSTRRKTEIPRDFLLSKGVSYCLIFQEPESRQALLLSHWNSLKSRLCYKAIQMVNRQCQVHSSENVNSKKKVI